VQAASSPRLTHVLHGGGPRSHLSFRVLQGTQVNCSRFLFFGRSDSLGGGGTGLERNTLVNKDGPDMTDVKNLEAVRKVDYLGR